LSFVSAEIDDERALIEVVVEPKAVVTAVRVPQLHHGSIVAPAPAATQHFAESA
jgi:hypothetical protein